MRRATVKNRQRRSTAAGGKFYLEGRTGKLEERDRKEDSGLDRIAAASGIGN